LAFLFEDYILDPDRRELRRGSEIVPVEPQVFDLLAFLIGNRDRVVSKDDLLASVWDGRIVSESTLGTRMNAARAAIADSGEAQRLIRTLPRKGFRFVGDVREEHVLPRERWEAAPPAVARRAPIAETPQHAGMSQRLNLHRAFSTARLPLIVLAAIGGAAAASLAFFVWHSGGASRSELVPAVTGKFDASVIPLINDDDRSRLAEYPLRRNSKAVALSALGLGVAIGATDLESAKQEALQQCAMRGKIPCRLYAIGTDVVWPKSPKLLSADLRQSPLDIALDTADLPTLTVNQQESLREHYLDAADHKALALGDRKTLFVYHQGSRAEAIRIAVERCAELYKLTCLLVSVDGLLTVQIPKSHPVTRVFTLTDEPDMSEQDKRRIGTIYQGPEWRALVRGGSGTWQASAAAASEADAVDDAFRLCAARDHDCRLYAIGNFRVGDGS
jgi:DNA-binding winged helix-turn-helix (wHTH) protein